jgi:hypothetical protein
VLSRDSAVVRYGSVAMSRPQPASVNGTSGAKGERKRKKEKEQREGAPQPFSLGDLIPGTYCSRIYSDCDRKPCRLQSPNFPGVYPRNVTCYYAVRQHEVHTHFHFTQN